MFEEVQITLVINSLNSSKSEFEQSNEIISYFKSKKIKNYIIEDINQEMNFNKETKLNKNIRTSYNKIGKIFKINNTYSIPQIIINNKLILSYKQFKNFSESYPFLFQKIITGKNCCHIRFFEDEMVYPTQSLIDNSEIICIYCYSLKKIKKHVFLSCNLRDSYNKIINDILTYCEDNQITIDLVDYENLYYYNLSMYSQEINEKINLKEDFCVVGNYISDLDNLKIKEISISKEKNLGEFSDKEYEILCIFKNEIIPYASEYYVGIIQDFQDFDAYLDKNIDNFD